MRHHCDEFFRPVNTTTRSVTVMSNPLEKQRQEIFCQLVDIFYSDVCRRNKENLQNEATFTRSAKHLLDDPLVAFLKCFGGLKETVFEDYLEKKVMTRRVNKWLNGLNIQI